MLELLRSLYDVCHLASLALKGVLKGVQKINAQRPRLSHEGRCGVLSWTTSTLVGRGAGPLSLGLGALGVT